MRGQLGSLGQQAIQTAKSRWGETKERKESLIPSQAMPAADQCFLLYDGVCIGLGFSCTGLQQHTGFVAAPSDLEWVQ